MLRLPRALAAGSLIAGAACVSTPLRQIPPAIPEAGEGVLANAANGGRVQSIAINPTDRRNAIIAMQFGGMWKTSKTAATFEQGRSVLLEAGISNLSWFRADDESMTMADDVDLRLDRIVVRSCRAAPIL